MIGIPTWTQSSLVLMVNDKKTHEKGMGNLKHQFLKMPFVCYVNWKMGNMMLFNRRLRKVIVLSQNGATIGRKKPFANRILEPRTRITNSEVAFEDVI